MNNQNNLQNFNLINDKLLNFPLSLIYMNIRSLRKNFNTFIAHIHKIIHFIKVIILVETNITDNENNFYSIKNFNSIFLNREGNGGGIAVYIKENINFTTNNLNTQNFESLHIDLTIGTDLLTLLPIYRPPRTNIKLFINELEENINQFHKKRAMIVIGDMNIDIAKEKTKTTRTYIDMMSSNGLQCMVNEVTREVKNKGTCIDHMFVRNNKSITNAQSAVILTNISDHYSLFGCVGEDDKQRNTNMNGNDDSQGTENLHLQNEVINSYKVNKLIKQTNWNINTNETQSCDKRFENIYNKFNEIYIKSKQNKKNIKKRNDYPWLTEQILSYCEVRDKLYQRYQKSKNNSDKEIEYKIFNNKLNRIITDAKNEHRRKEFIKNRNNMRGTWLLINDIIGKKVDSVDDVIKKNFRYENLNIVTNNFAIKFKQNVQNIMHDCDIKTLNSTETRIQNTIYVEQANELEILNILKSLNSNKGAGADAIRPKDIKLNAEQLTPVITTLINTSLNECTLPKLLKTSLVRPIFKSGNKTDYNNYRPISILPVVEKVIEEIMVRRLNDFLKKYNVINKNQYGFQKGKNINKLLGHFSNHINKCLDRNTHCLALFIDFSKAFDTLSHTNLINILERNGIRGQCLKWFKNYFTCRTYRVKVDGKLSKEIDLNTGVPQGSKLGPILYLIYTNEMLNQIKNSATFAYADDTAIVVSHDDLPTAVQMMQSELDVITRWCHDNGLIINATKTKLMHIRLPHIPKCNINIKFHDTNCLHKNNFSETRQDDKCKTYIELVDTYKYLGVIVDQNLNWKQHIIFLNKKLRKTSYVLYHLNNCAPLTVTKQAYFSLAESYLRHGITAFGSATHCKILQQTQNRLIKTLMKNKTTNSTQNISNNEHSQTNNNIDIKIKSFCKQHNILNVKNIYKSIIINEFHDENFLEPLDHRYNTRRRSEGRYKVPRFTNKHGKNTLDVQLPSAINSMPVNLLNNENKFKRKILVKKYLVQSQ